MATKKLARPMANRRDYADASDIKTDPVQRRFFELLGEQRRIVAELRVLRKKLTTGTCEACGAIFRRTRPTKRYCSMRCGVRSAPSSKGGIDLVLIRDNWAALEASGMLPAQSLRVLRSIALDGHTYDSAAGVVGLSRQRAHQIVIRATAQARMAASIALANEKAR